MKLLRRLVCLVLGHRWARFRYVCHRSVNLSHLSPLAGAEGICGRCGHHWVDQCDDCTTTGAAWVRVDVRKGVIESVRQ